MINQIRIGEKIIPCQRRCCIYVERLNDEQYRIGNNDGSFICTLEELQGFLDGVVNTSSASFSQPYRKQT